MASIELAALCLNTPGVPPETEAPPIMAAARGRGLRWFNPEGAAPVTYDPPKPEWAD